MHAFVFIDTNVPLHHRSFDEVDWPREFGVDSVTLVFAPVTLAELDDKKWSGGRRERARAKAVLKKLDALQVSSTPVKVRDGVNAIALDAEPADALFAQHRLSTKSQDDRLLASFIEFRQAHPSDRVLILAADTGLGAKARSRQIELVAPAEHLELPDEPDDVERERDKYRRELAELKSAAPDLRLTFGDDKYHTHYSLRSFSDYDAAAMERLLGEWRSRHPHISTTFPPVMEAISGISLKSLAGFPGVVTEDDAAKHNAAIDAYYKQYQDFLKTWPGAVRGVARIVTLEFVLENSGTAPADDVDVQISTDAAGVWLRKMPKLPRAPSVPKARSPFDIPNISALALQPSYLRDHLLSRADANEDGPNISGDGGNQVVQYGIRRVKHHVPCALPKVYFQFGSDAQIRSFAANVRIVAANIRNPETMSLHVEVERGAAVVPKAPTESPRDD
jgi:hypothetical protein